MSLSSLSRFSPVLARMARLYHCRRDLSLELALPEPFFTKRFPGPPTPSFPPPPTTNESEGVLPVEDPLSLSPKLLLLPATLDRPNRPLRPS